MRTDYQIERRRLMNKLKAHIPDLPNEALEELIYQAAHLAEEYEGEAIGDE